MVASLKKPQLRTLSQAIYAAAYVASRESDALAYAREQSDETQRQAYDLHARATSLWEHAESLGITDEEKAEAHRWVTGQSES